jgi:polysaccharide biosynthesis transport protein
VSQKRPPEQETVLAQGYADYFNQPSSQDVLRRHAGVGVDPSVTLDARIAAASPIVYIEATAADPNIAEGSATRMALALRDDVDAGLQGNSAAQIQQLQRQLDAARAQNNSSEVGTLQDAITKPALPADTSNVLERIGDHVGTAAEVAGLLRMCGLDVSTNKLQWWARAGYLVACGRSSRGWPTYRITDVVEVYAERSQRRRAGRSTA